MEVKEILLEAAELIGNDTLYMCHAISLALGDIEYTIPEEIIEAGFTYENYEKFICENYPSLKQYLLRNREIDNAWIIISERHHRIFGIIESKIKFLKYLANGQENNDSSCPRKV